METTYREIAAFPSGTSYNSPLGGAEMRGVEFVGANRAFVLQRSPPALIAFLDSTPTDVLETCASPTFLDQFEAKNAGLGPRLFVTCPADGEIYVYDPSVPRLEKTFLVGRGPAGLVFDDTLDVNGVPRNVAYVVGFGDNNISVVDLQPGSETEYHVIQRIGFPRTMPR
jgi:DNA-binding beta-propeller fold protein YncE